MESSQGIPSSKVVQCDVNMPSPWRHEFVNNDVRGAVVCETGDEARCVDVYDVIRVAGAWRGCRERKQNLRRPKCRWIFFTFHTSELCTQIRLQLRIATKFIENWIRNSDVTTASTRAPAFEHRHDVISATDEAVVLFYAFFYAHTPVRGVPHDDDVMLRLTSRREDIRIAEIFSQRHNN